MKLYFRNSQAKFRPIANIDGRKPDKEIAKRNFSILKKLFRSQHFKETNK